MPYCPSTNSPVLPRELILYTLEEHLGDHKPTIKSASLLSSEYRDPCQRILFKKLSLRYPEYENAARFFIPCNRINRISSPRLLGYINELELFLGHAPFLCPPVHASVSPLADILYAIPSGNIQRFTLNGPVSELPEDMVSAILNICGSPSLVSLTMDRGHAQLLTACGPRLRHLNIQHATHRPLDLIFAANQRIPCPNICLETLQIGPVYTMDQELALLLDESSNVDLSGLKTIQATLGNCDMEEALFQPLLSKCSLSLQALTINYSQTCIRFGPCSASVGLSQMINLQHIVFLGEETLLANLSSEILSTISSGRNLLSTIELQLHLRQWDCNKHLTIYRSRQSWERLDQLLANPETFPLLRQVKISVSSPAGTFKSFGAETLTVSRLKMVLAQLVKRRML